MFPLPLEEGETFKKNIQFFHHVVLYTDQYVHTKQIDGNLAGVSGDCGAFLIQ